MKEDEKTLKNFSSDTMKVRRYIQHTGRNNVIQPRILYSAKLS